jgi:hypothetical protein
MDTLIKHSNEKSLKVAQLNLQVLQISNRRNSVIIESS